MPTTTVADVPSGTGASAWSSGIDADDPDVAEQVPADDRGRHAVTVPELGVELPGAVHAATSDGGDVRDHVGVREDRALRIDDEAGALGLAVGAEVGVERHDAGSAAGVDRGRVEAVAELGRRGGRCIGAGEGALDDDGAGVAAGQARQVAESEGGNGAEIAATAAMAMTGARTASL